MKKTFKYQLEIEVVIDEENINKKYPNYKINYNSIEDFADSRFNEECEEVETEFLSDSLEKWGYRIVKKRTRIK